MVQHDLIKLAVHNNHNGTFGFQVGLKYNESVVIRITGCPNGCARPYMAELGFVGDGPNSYQVIELHLCQKRKRPCRFPFRWPYGHCN